MIGIWKLTNIISFFWGVVAFFLLISGWFLWGWVLVCFFLLPDFYCPWRVGSLVRCYSTNFWFLLLPWCFWPSVFCSSFNFLLPLLQSALHCSNLLLLFLVLYRLGCLLPFCCPVAGLVLVLRFCGFVPGWGSRVRVGFFTGFRGWFRVRCFGARGCGFLLLFRGSHGFILYGYEGSSIHGSFWFGSGFRAVGVRLFSVLAGCGGCLALGWRFTLLVFGQMGCLLGGFTAVVRVLPFCVWFQVRWVRFVNRFLGVLFWVVFFRWSSRRWVLWCVWFPALLPFCRRGRRVLLFWHSSFVLSGWAFAVLLLFFLLVWVWVALFPFWGRWWCFCTRWCGWRPVVCW